MRSSSLTLDRDERDLFDTTLAWIRKHEPAATVRDRHDRSEGYDRAGWKRASHELGIAAVALPEEVGGLGLPDRALSVVCEAAGTQLALEPLVPTVVMAATAVRAAPPGEARDELLAGIAAGDVLAALAVGTRRGPFATGGAVRTGGQDAPHVLDGTVPAVVGAGHADVVVVLAEDDDRPGLFTVRPGDPGVTVTACDTLDLGRPVARVELRSATGVALTERDPTIDVGRLLCTLAVHQLVELVGVASACLELAVDFARTRVQFGRTIGSFQAVKHRCVDMLVDLERARSHAYAARAELGAGSIELMAAASAARIVVGEAVRRIASSSLHVHGGLGFTWEHDIHLYLRRAKATGALLGSVDAHLDLLAAHIGVAGDHTDTREIP